MNKIVLGHKGAVSIVTMMILSKLVLFEPVLLSKQTYLTSYMSVIYSAVVNLVIFLAVSGLVKNKNFFDKTKPAFVNGIINAIAFVLFLLLAVITLATLCHTVKMYSLSNTPILILFTVTAVIAVFIASGGFENILRLSTTFLGISVFAVILAVVLCFKYYDINNLFPFFGYGFNNMILAHLKHIALFSDIFILFLIPNKDAKNINKYAISATATSALLFVAVTISFNLVFFKTADSSLSAFYMLSSAMYNAGLIQNLSAIYFFISVIPCTITIALYLVLSLNCLVFSTKLQDSKPLLYPLFFILLSATYYVINRFTLDEYYIIDYITGIVFILSLISLLFFKRGADNA